MSQTVPLSEKYEALFWELVDMQLKDLHKLDIQQRLKERAVVIQGLGTSIGATIDTEDEKKALRLKGCKICGYDIFEATVVHHIDKCRDNNASYNLIPLCRNCHTLVHRGSIELDPIELKRNDKEVSMEYQLSYLKKQSPELQP